MRCTDLRFTTVRFTAVQFTAVQFISIGLLTALAIAGLEAGSVRAQQPDATTIAIAVAQGNAQCLIKTGTMKPEQAQSIADGFLAQKKISPQTSNAVKNTAGFSDLMNAYIADQGGCSALVEALQR